MIIIIVEKMQQCRAHVRQIAGRKIKMQVRCCYTTCCVQLSIPQQNTRGAGHRSFTKQKQYQRPKLLRWLGWWRQLTQQVDQIQIRTSYQPVGLQLRRWVEGKNQARIVVTGPCSDIGTHTLSMMKRYSTWRSVVVLIIFQCYRVVSEWVLVGYKNMNESPQRRLVHVLK